MKSRPLPLIVAALCLLGANSPAAYDLIPLGASGWKYLVATQEVSTPLAAWRAVSYDDSLWSVGQQPIGYPSPVDRVGYETNIITMIRASSTEPTWTSCYFRKNFTITNLAGVGALVLNVYVDDGCVAWVNGVEAGRINVGTGDLPYSATATLAEEERLMTVTFTNLSALVVGNNVLAIHGLNGNTTSSDFHVMASLTTADDVPPTLVGIDPPNGSRVPNLTFINVVFSESVSGVDASDLLINGTPATSIVTNNPNDYTFYFPQPPTGSVSVAFSAFHGIADIDAVPDPFAGGSWTYTLDPSAASSQFIISEIQPDNATGIQDEDGNRGDWIEIYNPTAGDASLAGWYLTDVQGSNKWRFPSHINMTLGAHQFLIVWADSKNRTNNIARLHANFDLRQNGEYLGLLDPAGHAVSEFAPAYPRVETDKSYGRDRVDPDVVGFFDVPTPGRANSTSGANFAPEPVFSLDSGVYTNDSLVVSIAVDGGALGEIRYTLDGTEPTNNSALYTGPLTVSSNVFIKARVYVSSPGIWPSKIIAKTYFLLDASARDFTSNLPIIVINTSGRAIPASVSPSDNPPRVRGDIVVLDTYRGRSSLRGKPDHIGMAQYEIFGQTSAGFPKKPFTVELNDAYGNDESHSLLGLPKEADWKLRNPWSDKCLMNDFLGYELFEDMGHYSCRRRLVEVFLCAPDGGFANTTKITYPGSYYGVLCFFEKIEVGKNRVEIEEITPAQTTEPEIAGGYIFKKDKDSTGDLNFTVPGGQGHSAEGMKFHDPKPRDITVVQQNWLINYLTRMSQALYASDWLTRTGTNHYSYYMNLDAFADQHWIVEFTKQIDGYRLSDFFHKSRYGKVEPSPIWDWNLSFGNANYLEGGKTNGWYWNEQQEGMGSAEHIWLRRLLYGTNNIVGGTGGANGGPGSVMNSGDPEFIQKVIDRWGQLRTNVLNGDRVVGRIDEIATLLTESAGRNYQKWAILTAAQWPEPSGPPAWDVKYDNQPTYAAIISEMKKWTRGRFNWLDAQIVRTPTVIGGGQVSPGFAVTMGAPAGSTLYYTLDGTDPRLPGGNVSPSAKVYTQPILITNNAMAFARARIGTNQYSWSPPALSSLFTTIPALRITEIMYHPADPPQPSNFKDEDFEFIELRNTSAGALNIGGYKISAGIDFLFPNITLNPGQRVVVVKNLLAFSALYNTNGMIIAGEFANQPGNTNNLDNTGERLVLTGRLGEPILDFRYDDDWYKITDGLGFSLVIADDSLPPSAWSDPANWRAGGVVNGTPGAPEPTPTVFPRVVINEALTHTDLPAVDTIELQNLSASPADVSGWYLSDDRLSPKKYRIPNGTIIPAGGFITFDENQFNPGGAGFALSSTGDEVYLASADGPGNLTGYLHGFDFGAAANGVTFGRYINSIGKEHFVAQTASTLNGPNAGPRVDNVVISEIHYHPPDVYTNGAYWNNSEDEYVELRNRSGSPVNLYYPTDPTIPWKLNRAVEFDFPPGTSIPANGYVLVVNFNPASDPSRLADFRARFNVPAGVQVFGPYQGDLSNADETLGLFMPDTPFTNINNFVEVPYVLVEEVAYADTTPWPLAADGSGFSLHRRVLGNYANDPINWESSSPTPGQGYTPGAPPTITGQPGSVSILESNSVTLTVTASGSALRYQWRKNGENLAGKTNASLTFNPAQLGDSGQYQVLVLNNSSYAASTAATLTVIQGLKILLQPESLTVRPPTNVTFTVGASSSSPIRYQWRFNGRDLAGETNASLVLNNVTNTHEGFYTVVCRDAVVTTETAPARLTVLIPPIMVSPSPAAPLQLTAVAGETITLSAQLHGTLPIFSRWRLTRTVGGTVTIGDLFNQQPVSSIPMLVSNTSGGRVILSLTNVAGGSLAASAVVTNAVLTVLTDTDGDGIPDAYEIANGMNPNDPSDANIDSDGDTMKNKDEYIAGTNPHDPTSYLKVDRIATIGSAVLYFGAVSNRSYTVQYSDSLTPAAWQRLSDFGPRITNWTATATDPDSPPKRFYRLVTPALP